MMPRDALPEAAAINRNCIHNEENTMDNGTLTNRHDFLLLFEVTNGNPNGDPRCRQHATY
jgi:hypothetical protein